MAEPTPNDALEIAAALETDGAPAPDFADPVRIPVEIRPPPAAARRRPRQSSR
jgi:hypothetical protein